jgi:3-oxoacyl-[acyl-carrier protein] reductase
VGFGKTMKSAIIFGGSRGIGWLISEYLIEQGYKVSIVSRQASRENIHPAENTVQILQTDITNETMVKACFDQHLSHFNYEPELVINAAAIQGPIGPTWTLSSEEWEQTVRINLIGSFHVTKYAVQAMLRSGSGSIILFSGGGAAYARPNFSSYGVSKTGVLRLVETVSEELKQINSNIIINAIAPGAVKTKMTEEIITAGDQAGAKAYLEAEETVKNGGTPSEQITSLIDYLADHKRNREISGRLIHVREDYLQFPELLSEQAGKLRRVSFLE